jgi:hypothetical protein
MRQRLNYLLQICSTGVAMTMLLTACGSATGVKQNVPPTVHITSPGPGRTLYRNAEFTIAADAADSDGFVRRVDFYVDGELLFTDESPPYTGRLAIGNGRELRAVATDDLSATAFDLQAVSITNCPVNIDCSEELSPTGMEWANLPVVHWTSPRPGQVYRASAEIQLAVDVKPSIGSITRVEFLADGRIIGTVTAPPYRHVWRNVPPGSYELTVRAWDTYEFFGTTASNVVVVE